MWRSSNKARLADVKPGSSNEQAGAYGSVTHTSRSWRWEKLGSSLKLLSLVAVGAANRFLYLVLISFEVLYSKDHLMSCDPTTKGMNTALVCEFTKQCVRFFPVLGLVVLVLAANRMLLQKRIFYRVLKRGALVDFDNVNPFTDPIFCILVMDLLFAVLHFLLMLWDVGGLSSFVGELAKFDTLLSSRESTSSGDSISIEDLRNHEAMARMELLATFYVIPAVVFMSFLYMSYDIERALVPLSKFIEEDVEEAKLQLARLVVLNERACEQTVSSDFMSRFQNDPTPQGGSEGFDADTVYRAFIEKAAAQSEDSAGKAGCLTVRRPTSSLWPGKLLLNRNFPGVEGRHFRLAWYIVSVFSFASFMGTGVWTLQALGVKMHNLVDGQADTDWPSLLVAVFHMILWLWLVEGYLMQTWIH